MAECSDSDVIMPHVSNVSLSQYVLNLDSIARSRYETKLKVHQGTISLPDPYNIPQDQWIEAMNKWPPVEYADMYNYLVNTPGIYTKEATRAYKSLDGYNFFISGHVHTCLFYDIAEDSPVCFIKASVTPSQSVTKKPHEPWVCLDKKQGYVISAHCTCMAGLGEACSHIAAVLFKIEAGVKLGFSKQSRTSTACVWNRFYRKEVTPQPLREINFSRHKKGSLNRKRITPQIEVEPVRAALRQLKQIFPKACVLTKNDSDTDTASEDEEIPQLLTRFHEVEYSILTPPDLQKKCEGFMKDFKPTQHQIDNLEKMTRSQADSALWHRHRGKNNGHSCP
ncbi:uncharacterized protein LOC121386449 [Gigantopelta aegis]|uniref:uncharacterized protein LOC121386449 n=1 Tax=Gigantopelta aegis TaxID=1735272 RepID=UPI001B88872B|nr:uncharacterized protein LOC121386449 [Gigantopelta aegis]